MCKKCEETYTMAEDLWEIGRSLDEIADILFQNADKRADRYRLQAELSRELAREVYPLIDLVVAEELEKDVACVRNNS